ncbi:lipoprotein [Streptomyces coeruleoprunus]|uniref:lipoprotein n=1 Tax=Streptomyces coeruleoprunus TaxID=285563 RepID=UPI0035F097DD
MRRGGARGAIRTTTPGTAGVRAARAAVAAGAAAALLAGCSSAADAGPPASSASASAAPSAAGPKTAAKGGTVGPAGSACPLPVTFDVAADWKPEAIKPIEDPDLRSLVEQGPVTAVCEIDAKPAGHIGFLRVFTNDRPGDTPRRVLEGFTAAEGEVTAAVYRDIKAGAVPATEVTYTVTSRLTEESKDVRALAVSTPRGAAVLYLGGLDSEEHRAMLPAYELAKASLAVTP